MSDKSNLIIDDIDQSSESELNKPAPEFIDDTPDNESDTYKTHHHSHHHSHHSHHSHHHRHHKHHRHHHKSKSKGVDFNKLRKNIKRFFRHNRKQLTYIAVALLVFLLLTGVAKVVDNTIRSEAEASSKVTIKAPVLDNEVTLVHPAVVAYLNTDSAIPARNIFDQYRDNGSRLDIQLPVKFYFDITGETEELTATDCLVKVSENSDFTNAMVFPVDPDDTNLDIYNLFTNKRYYYSINVTLSDGTDKSINGSFRTANTPRIISVDGIQNVRDIGGWVTSDGKIIKQGILYRGTELDGAVDTSYFISDEGIDVMINTLGIRYEMDLRQPAESEGIIQPLRGMVSYKCYGMYLYNDLYTDKGKEAIREVFSALAKEENYPMYMHCTHGTDRTGITCYLLEAMLGMEEDDLIREYQLSSLSQGKLWALDRLYIFIDTLNTYKGSTLQEKAVNYLLDAGVTQKEIDSIRDIFLE